MRFTKNARASYAISDNKKGGSCSLVFLGRVKDPPYPSKGGRKQGFLSLERG